MSGLNDFLKGISAFNQGLSEYAQSEASRDTQEQLAEIDAQLGTDPMNPDRQAAVDQLSQNFALRLQQAGASAQEAGMAAGRIGLTEYQNRMMAFNQQRTEMQQKIDAARALKSGQDPFKVFNMKLQQEKFLRDTTENFESQTSELRESIESADKAMAAIKMGTTNAAASGAVGTMLAKALQPGNLTDREQAVFKGNRQLLNTAKRLYTTFVSGEGFTPKDQEELMEYVLAMKQANVETFDTRKKDFISGNSESIGGVGMDPNRLNKALDAYKYTAPEKLLQEELTQEDVKIKALAPFIKDTKKLQSLSPSRRKKYEAAYQRAMLTKRLKQKYLESVRKVGK